MVFAPAGPEPIKFDLVPGPNGTNVVVENAGQDASEVLGAVRKGEPSFGYNAQTESYGDLVEMGIIDPTKVVRVALQNAASVAGLMITTEAMIAPLPEKEKPALGPEYPPM